MTAGYPAGSQEPPTPGYTLQEAAALLGIGVNTLRRRIAAGQVRAEQIQRPQGYAWRVYLDVEPASTQHPPQESEQEAPRTLPQPPAPAEAMATLIQATLTPIVAPLVAELAASRQANERQAAHIEDLARENGRLTAELEAARARAEAVEARHAENPDEEQPAPPSDPPSPFPAPQEPATNGHARAPWWQRWGIWLAGGAMVLALGTASCQTPGSPVKNASLCRQAQAQLEVFGNRNVEFGVWAGLNSIVNIAEKVC